MAEENYRRLECGGCGVGFLRLAQGGRPPKKCPKCFVARPDRFDPVERNCRSCGCVFTARRMATVRCRRDCGINTAEAPGSCVHCDAPTKRFKSSGKAAKFCGPLCIKKASGKRLVGVGENDRNARSCVLCGALFKARNAEQQGCSRPCRIALKHPSKPLIVRPCDYCGTEFKQNTPLSTYCTKLCKSAGWLQKYRGGPSFGEKRAAAEKREALRSIAERFDAVRAVARAVARVARARARAEAQRAEADARRVASEARRLMAAENAKRSKRAARIARKALERAARVEVFDPLEVLERDGWRCQICGVSTPKKLRGSCDPRAPELDHVVALANGGEHSRANTQCACRRCNGLKGAGKPQGQISLFA